VNHSKPPPPLAASPAHVPVRDARARLERTIAALRLVPVRFERQPTSDALRRALGAMFVALDTGTEAFGHDEAVDEAAAATAAAIALLEPIARARDVGGSLRAVLVELEEARVSLVAAADGLAEARLVRRGGARTGRPSDLPPPIAPFRASVSLPRVHALAHAPLVGEVDLDPAVPLAERRRRRHGAPLPQQALQALAEAARRGEGADMLLGPEPVAELPEAPAIAALEQEEVRRVAEDCLSDLGSLGLLRAPGPTERWTDAAAFEQRLLDVLDALVSLGAEILPLVPMHLAEAPAPDPARAFAATFALGCLAGADATAAAVELFLTTPAESFTGARDGILLASSPALVEALLERLRRGLAVEARARAIEALLARGASVPADLLGDVLAGERAARALLARAVDAAGLAAHDAVALLEDLRDVDDEEGDAAADATFFAASEALLRRGHARARDVLRGAIDRASARADRAASLLCLVGNAEDAPRLLRRFAASPVPLLARALGRFGHVDALGALSEALSSDDEPLAAAAADALFRITGAPLVESVEIPWGEGAPPPADGEAPRPMRKLSRPSRERAAWEAWLARDGRALDRAVRLRAGRPMHPLQIVDELLAAETPLGDRADAVRELSLLGVSARVPRLEDWVAAQRSALGDVRGELERARLAAGRWGRVRG
jgi:hypothetical protein